LLDRNSVAISLCAEMLLYMASRAQMVEEVIRPALDAGRIVVSDRFLLASLIYQGYAGGLPTESIAQVGQVATGGLLPDLTVVLDLAPEIARSRVGSARDRIEDRPATYQERVREGYRDAAFDRGGRSELGAFYPAPMVVIDASADTETVFERIKSEVERVLALGARP
jgi:dTMP kinase